MKRVWPLAALGVGAYLLFAVVTLPASLLSSRLGAVGVNAVGLEGTVWKGSAQALQVGNSNLGSVTWKLHVLPLFADLQLNRSDGFARSAVTVSTSGRVSLKDLNASLPLSALPAGAIRGGWNGVLNLKLAKLVIEKGWPVAAEGTVEAIDLIGPARRPAKIGSYRVIFPAAPAAKSQDTLTGALTDMGGGPLQISGTLQLKTNRSYQLDSFITPGPNTPREIADALQFLGAPDAQGRRPFSTDGTM